MKVKRRDQLVASYSAKYWLAHERNDYAGMTLYGARLRALASQERLAKLGV